MAQVPFLDCSATPPPSRTRQHASSCSRINRSESVPRLKPKFTAASTTPATSEYSSPSFHGSVPTPCSHRRHTTVGQALPSAPYETHVDLPPEAMRFRRATASPPPHRSPPTPEISSLSSTNSVSPPPQEPSAHPLPGTMSSRTGRSQETSPLHSKTQKREPFPRSQPERKSKKRFASAFRGMFKRDPVDESELERIDDRHWTEEN